MTEHKTFNDALVAAQAELPRLEKSAENPHFKSRFISLDKIMAEVLPVLNRHGLAWSAFPTTLEGQPALRYELRGHGESISDTKLLLAAKDDPQGQGAAITYARRYSITAVLGISADEDDDGNRANAARHASRERAQAPTNGTATSPALTAEQRAKVVKAIEDKGKNLDLILGAVGAESTDDLTAADARKIKVLLDGES